VGDHDAAHPALTEVLDELVATCQQRHVTPLS
jgi:hypothetical protein